MPDEGLHEIQLNGKQLVFLFMTATVVAVVIFLCGVMVGRGVPTQRAVPVLATDGADPTTPDDQRGTGARAESTAGSTTAGAPSASSKLGVSYPERLEQPDPVAEDLSPATAPKEAFKTAVATTPPPAPTPAKPDKAEKTEKAAKPAKTETARTIAAAKPAAVETAAAPKADAVPTGSGFVVQVAAVRQRSEADNIRGRLARKGYAAFVTTADAPGATTYRVRVGKFNSRREADTVAAKLEREEQFKPWVTR